MPQRWHSRIPDTVAFRAGRETGVDVEGAGPEQAQTNLDASTPSLAKDAAAPVEGSTPHLRYG